MVWNWYHFVAIAILHQPRPTDSADINTRLQLSDTSSIPPMHGGFLLWGILWRHFPLFSLAAIIFLSFCFLFVFLLFLLFFSAYILIKWKLILFFLFFLFSVFSPLSRMLRHRCVCVCIQVALYLKRWRRLYGRNICLNTNFTPV